MNKIAILLVAAIWLITGTVSAAPCVWTPAETEDKTVHMQVGEVTLVQVNTDVRGSFTAPEGWTTEFVQGDCFGRNPDTCGVWKARKTTTTGGTSTAHFSVSEDACDGPREWTVTIVAEAEPEPVAPYTGATWTEPEKTEVQDHARSPHASSNAGQSVQGHIGLLWAPNISTTTRDTWGVEGFLGALVTRHLRLGGALRYAQTGIPVEEALRPVPWQITETQVYAGFRITGVITPAEWVNIDLGGQVGALVLHYPETQIRQLQDGRVETILEETQVTPTAGVLGQVSFYPGSSGFMLGLGAGVDLSLTDVRRRPGSGLGGTGVNDENANKKPYAFPAFMALIGGRF